jgi:sulfocyanin
MRRPIRLTLLAGVVVLTAAALAACGSSNSKATGTTAAAATAGSAKMSPYSGPDKILAFDTGSKTVTVNLVAGESGAASSFNYNGYSKGGMHVEVPTGWRVKVSMVDQSNTPHSALIVPWDERLGGTLHPAFAGSAPADFRSGIEKGDDPQKFSFTASQAGEYAIVCGVPGHIDAGMWDAFDVVDGLSAPQVLVNQ